MSEKGKKTVTFRNYNSLIGRSGEAKSGRTVKDVEREIEEVQRQLEEFKKAKETESVETDWEAQEARWAEQDFQEWLEDDLREAIRRREEEDKKMAGKGSAGVIEGAAIGERNGVLFTRATMMGDETFKRESVNVQRYDYGALGKALYETAKVVPDMSKFGTTSASDQLLCVAVGEVAPYLSRKFKSMGTPVAFSDSVFTAAKQQLTIHRGLPSRADIKGLNEKGEFTTNQLMAALMSNGQGIARCCRLFSAHIATLQALRGDEAYRAALQTSQMLLPATMTGLRAGSKLHNAFRVSGLEEEDMDVVTPWNGSTLSFRKMGGLSSEEMGLFVGNLMTAMPGALMGDNIWMDVNMASGGKSSTFDKMSIAPFLSTIMNSTTLAESVKTEMVTNGISNATRYSNYDQRLIERDMLIAIRFMALERAMSNARSLGDAQLNVVKKYIKMTRAQMETISKEASSSRI